MSTAEGLVLQPRCDTSNVFGRDRIHNDLGYHLARDQDHSGRIFFTIVRRL